MGKIVIPHKKRNFPAVEIFYNLRYDFPLHLPTPTLELITKLVKIGMPFTLEKYDNFELDFKTTYEILLHRSGCNKYKAQLKLFIVEKLISTVDYNNLYSIVAVDNFLRLNRDILYPDIAFEKRKQETITYNWNNATGNITPQDMIHYHKLIDEYTS